MKKQPNKLSGVCRQLVWRSEFCRLLELRLTDRHMVVRLKREANPYRTIQVRISNRNMNKVGLDIRRNMRYHNFNFETSRLSKEQIYIYSRLCKALKIPSN